MIDGVVVQSKMCIQGIGKLCTQQQPPHPFKQVYNLAEYAEMREGAQQSSTQPEEEDHEFEIGWADVTPANQSFGGSRKLPVVNQMKRQLWRVFR